MVLVNSNVRTLLAADYPDGLSADAFESILTGIREGWGTDAAAGQLAPSSADDARFRAWLGRCQRLTCTGEQAYQRVRAILKADLRHTLPAMHAPTLC